VQAEGAARGKKAQLANPELRSSSTKYHY
jgi:hypothetical protein